MMRFAQKLFLYLKKIKSKIPQKISFYSVILLVLVTLNVFLSEYKNPNTYQQQILGTYSGSSTWESGEYTPGTIDFSSGKLTISTGTGITWDKGTPGFITETEGYSLWSWRAPYYGADLTNDGTYLYILVGNNSPYLIRYNPETNSFKLLQEGPTSFYQGASLVFYNDALYAINGGTSAESGEGTKHFYKYDIATNTWSRLADAPDNWERGGDLVSDGNGTFYAVRGGSTYDFWSYDVANDIWDESIPNLTTYYIYNTNDHPLEYVNEPYGDPEVCSSGCIYAFRGGNQYTFLRFDIGENQWDTVTNTLDRVSDGSAMVYDSNSGNIYAFRGNNDDEFMQYDVNAETWDETTGATPDAPGNVRYGGSLNLMNNYIYALRGNNTPGFWRYDISQGDWDSIATPSTVGTNGEDHHMVFISGEEDECDDSDGCLFVLRGANTLTFWRYDIHNRTWNDLDDTDEGMYRGSSICWNEDDYIYALRGNQTNDFYRYSIDNDLWTSAEDLPLQHSDENAYPAPGTDRVVYYGGSITCLGSTVYALKGYDSNHFYSFDGSSWSEESLTPYRTYYGSVLTDDDSQYLYALMGNYRGEFYRYDTNTNTWEERTDLPTSAYYGMDLAYDGTRYIYTLGNYSDNLWRYDITNNQWFIPGKFPERVSGYGTSLTFDTRNNLVYALRGFSTAEIYKGSFTTNQYISSTTWISETMDLTYCSAFTNFSSSTTTPGSSSVDFYSRTSQDQVNWSDWSAISGGTISSVAKQYLQIKIVLNSDGTNAPTVSSYTIDYSGDNSDPTNPTVNGYNSSNKETTLTSGNSYYYTQPYFELSGAEDSNSGIAGYYLSWTTSADHNPAENENYYQTSNSYQVNQPLSGENTYYLRLATKDNAGNIADPVTAFTYIYNGITSATNQTWTVQSDFETTGTTSSNINTSAGSGTNLTLSTISNGVWLDLPSAYGSALNSDAYQGTSMTYDGDDTVFVLRADNSKQFLKYTISTKTWNSLADITSTSNAFYGAVIDFVPHGNYCSDESGCIFALPGNNTTEFFRYDISANSWTQLADYNGSGGVHYGGSLAWTGGDYIFAFRGYNSNDFYRYSITNNSWTPKANLPYNAYYGASMTFVENGDYCDDTSGCLFILRGNNQTQFWRYDISNNTYEDLTGIPLFVQYGGTIEAYDGYIYASSGYISNKFLRYNISTGLWEHLQDLPSTHYFGSSRGMITDDQINTIYFLRGYNERSFYSYDISSNQWNNTGLPHGRSSAGFYYAGLSYDGNDTLYVARGNNTTDFYKYTISSEEWTQLQDIPVPMYISADILYKNNKVYATGSYNKDNESKMYIYDIATNTWATSGTADNWLGYGANLVDGGDGYIYTVRGQNTTSFYRYEIASGNWETLDNAPARIYQGSCAVKAGDYLYIARAQNTQDVFRYDLEDEEWDSADTIADTPEGKTIYQSDACAYDGNDLIYIPRGSTSNTEMLIYSISGNSWTITDTNDEYWYFGALETGPNGVLYGFRGYATNAMTRYVPSSSSTGFEPSGYWTSQIVNLGDIYDFNSLVINDTTAENTTLKYETRTCSNSGCAEDEDNANWSSWDEVSNQITIDNTDYYTIDSDIAPYFQIRASFTSNQMYTPTINDLSLNYFVDGTAPTNPDTLTVLDQSGGSISLTTDTWYSHNNPYFSWTGESDNEGGIGIEGYFVYFGTSNSADPATEGTLQTTAHYTAENLSTDTTYYLRIKTKDYAGNISDSAWEAFTYKLDNVAPSRPTNITADPSVPSSDNSFDFSWTAGSDSGGSPYFQYCYMTYYDAENHDDSEICIASSNLTLLDQEALSEGTNTFRIRAKDAAGNYSNNGEWETVQFRYAVTPPTLPGNVQHGAVEGDSYSHTFSWNEPTFHAFDITEYCYQINEVPTASYCNNETYGRWTSSSETNSRFLAAFRTPNTQPGTNYLYVVAKDEAGNVDWDAEFDCENGEGCISFSSETISPNTPQSFTLSDASDRLSSTYRLTLGWKKPADNEGSVLNKYNIYRSSDGDNYSLRESLQHSTNQDEYAYTDVALNNETTYYYKLTAVDLAGAESDYTSILSMKPEGKFTEAPDLVGSPTITPRIRSAVISWLTESGDIHPATSFIQFGTTTDLGSEQGNSEMTGSHEVTLVDLSPNTTYYIKLKWVDEDGNIGFSPQYTFDTNDAPSAPTSLSVSPSSSSDNSFSFDWEEPVDEGVTIGGYYYSVNSVPNEDNVSWIVDSAVGPIPSATQQGTNSFYVIAEDDTGNFNYNNYTSITFSITTSPPSAPTSISITDSSVRADNDFALTLRWSGAGNNTDHYNIYRGIDGNTYTLIAETDSTAFLDSGLETTNIYYYKVTAEDNANAEGSFSNVVSKQPTGRYITPPSYENDPSVVITSSTATITWTTDRASSSFVNYGTTSDLGESKGSLEEVILHQVELTGLSPSTAYAYRVQSFDEARDYTLDEAQSELFSFTTSVAPAISDVKVEDVRQTTAIVSWKTTTVSTSQVKYGKTTNYENIIDEASTGATTLHTVRLTDLDSESLYHIRVAGTDTEGNQLESDDYVFQTLAFPRIFNVTFQPVAEASSATLLISWETNVETDSIIEFAPEGLSFSEKVTSALTPEHEITVSDLLDNTIYQLRAKGRDQFGNIATSDLITYSTPFDTRPPKISEVSIETAIIGVGKEATSQIIVAWKTDENSTSQVEYGEGVGGNAYSNKTVEDATLTNSHLVIISDLSASKPYHLRVVSKDSAGNQTIGSDHAVITGRASDSVLDLIIVNIQDTFGWMGQIGNIFSNIF